MSVSLVPRTDDVDVYVVLDQLRSGRVWREIDEELANEASVVEWVIGCGLLPSTGQRDGRET
jgi:hypothetical protein